MKAVSHSISRTALIWPMAGLVLGAVASKNPLQVHRITLPAGIAAWWASMLIVLAFSAFPAGARFAAVIAGLFAAVPCFVDSSPLVRCLLMCFMGIPFIFSAAMVLASPICGFRSRLRHLCSWCGTRRIESYPRRMNTAALKTLTIATAVLSAALIVITTTPAFGSWLLLRWLAGGIGIFAVAEMAMAALSLVGAALGVEVPPLFRSPYRSASVNEFWTKRWNIPASELFRRYSFKPIARRNVGLALLATFSISAIAHVLLTFVALGSWEISLICGSFFLVQPIIIAAERRLAVRRWPAAAGWAWTLTALAITSPLIIEPLFQIFEIESRASLNLPLSILSLVGFVIVLGGIVTLASLVSLPADSEGLNK